MSWRQLYKTSRKRLENVLKTSWLYKMYDYGENIRLYQDVLKTSWRRVLTKTRNNLKRPTTTYKEQKTTWNDLQRTRNDLKRPTTTYNEQETTWNDPQQVRHNLQRPEPTFNKKKQDAKRPTTSRFRYYFEIWGKRFSFLTRFPPNIWLQSFKHCFTENHGKNRASNISILSCVFLRDIRFIFFCLGFVSWPFTNHRTAGKGRGYFFSSFLPLQPASHIVRSWAFAFIEEV